MELGLGMCWSRYIARYICILKLTHILSGSVHSSDVFYAINSADVYKWTRYNFMACLDSIAYQELVSKLMSY